MNGLGERPLAQAGRSLLPSYLHKSTSLYILKTRVPQIKVDPGDFEISISSLLFKQPNPGHQGKASESATDEFLRNPAMRSGLGFALKVVPGHPHASEAPGKFS